MTNFLIFTKSPPTWFLILLSGLLSVAAFPPSPLGFLAYVALIPLIHAFVRDDFHLSFEKGYLFGILLNFGVLYWLAVNKGTQWYWALLSMISGVLFLALNYGMIGLAIGLIGRRIGRWVGVWSFPVVWVAIEFLRSFGTLGFTWNQLCYTQTKALQQIQFASIFGTTGISCWIVLLNVLFYWGFNFRKKGKKFFRALTIVFLLIVIPQIHGALVMKRSTAREEARPVQVALVQPNVDPNAKWDRQAYRDVMQLLYDLSDSATISQRDLLVWPETATPTYLRSNRGGELDRIRRYITGKRIHLLTGVPDYEFLSRNEYRVYNATFLLRPGSRQVGIESYRKNRLVPFGEYIPLSQIIPELDNLNLGQGNFDAGQEMKTFRIPLQTTKDNAIDTTLCFASVVCYESSFPHIVRQATRMGAELLVIVSNDAWFGFTSGPFLHMEIAKLRAIENRIPVVRAANTGISLITDAYGRSLAMAPFGKKEWLTATLDQGHPHTLFVRWGNWMGILCVIIAMTLIIGAIYRGKT